MADVAQKLQSTNLISTSSGRAAHMVKASYGKKRRKLNSGEYETQETKETRLIKEQNLHLQEQLAKSQ